MDYTWKGLEKFFTSKTRTYIAVSVLALISSSAWALYIRATASGKSALASATDLSIMIMGSMITQIWAIQKNDIKIFLLWDVMSAVGTYIIVRMAL